MPYLGHMTMQAATGRIPTFTIGDRLRKSRLSAPNALDVRPFAELIGVSHGTVSRYELDALPADKMKPVVLKAWALATGVDYDWLRWGIGSDDDPEQRITSVYTHGPVDNVVPFRLAA